MDGKRSLQSSPNHDQPTIDEAILNLPEEIIVEILARVPVKSLLKFRCVSKSWLSVISSSQFVKTHLTISSNKADLSNSRVLMTIPDPDFEPKQCSLGSLIFEPVTVASLIDYPQKYPHNVVWVIGSCNGLVCIQIYPMNIYLWNPSTRVSKKLPSADAAVNLKDDDYNRWGFGYDEKDDDYKIVGIFVESRDRVLQESVTVTIYSLKANSWKRIDDCNGFPLEKGMFVNGKLHFSSISSDKNDRWNIVSLDLNSEEYGIVELPPKYGEGCFDIGLGVLDGCISVLCNYKRTGADFWVMKEYGIKESWTKITTIPYLSDNDAGRFVYRHPLCMLPNGDILLHFRMHFMIYNSKEKCFRSPGTSNLISLLSASVYVESLVSL